MLAHRQRIYLTVLVCIFTQGLGCSDKSNSAGMSVDFDGSVEGQQTQLKLTPSLTHGLMTSSMQT